MKQYCKRCKYKLIIPDFSEEQKLEIWALKTSSLQLFGIKKINESSNLSLVNSKALMHHVNKEYGHCIRCDYEELEHENIECPKCKGFNLNWNINQSKNNS